MRILSQEGREALYDFPYDKCLVYIYGDKKTIKLQPLGEVDSEYVIATYSTEEKARKAMSILHEEYQYTRRFETICNGSVDYPSQPIYEFQFPKDEEVEL